MTSTLVLQVLKPWLALILATATAEHVDPRTLAAIVFLESRGQPYLVSREKNGTCSVGLGMVNVPDCDPSKISALQDPAHNLRVAARILHANQRWCRRHKTEWRCRAGERVFRGGGGVNTYAGNTKRYAPRVARVRKMLPKDLTVSKNRARSWTRGPGPTEARRRNRSTLPHTDPR